MNNEEAPYGYCPECGAPGHMRERRPDGNDRCVNGHVYPSKNALKKPPGVTKLPDGSGFFTASLPLPKDHWLYAPFSGWDAERDCHAERPLPILTHKLRKEVVEAVRYAVRAATMQGTEKDFDPDALVQNAVVALCGDYGKATVVEEPKKVGDLWAERYAKLRRNPWVVAKNFYFASAYFKQGEELDKAVDDLKECHE